MQGTAEQSPPANSSVQFCSGQGYSAFVVIKLPFISIGYVASLYSSSHFVGVGGSDVLAVVGGEVLVEGRCLVVRNGSVPEGELLIEGGSVV